MKMNGEQVIPAPRARVWQALNDPEVLRQSIPGCTELVKHSATEFTAKVMAKVGPVKANFSGDVTLSKLNPPHSYLISGRGTGGAAGFAEGGAEVRLEEFEGSHTRLIYDVDAKVGGKLAQIGSRLIDSTARKMADAFFSRFSEVVTGDAPMAGKAPGARAEPAETAKPPAKKPPAKKASARKAPAAAKKPASRTSKTRSRAQPAEIAVRAEPASAPAPVRSPQPDSQQSAAVTNIWWIVGAGLAALLIILLLARL